MASRTRNSDSVLVAVAFAIALWIGGCRPASDGPPAAPTAPSIETWPDGTPLAYVEVNGIRMRVARAGSGPLVLMLHGFPDLAWTWRHQIPAIVDAGYSVLAPDMRGFGGTDAPAAIDAYDLVTICGDIVGLLDHAGVDRAILVSHDWGAAAAWSCALQQPDRFRAIVALSVPYGGRSPKPLIDILRERFGENFFYMIYFQEPGPAEAELAEDPRRTILSMYAGPGTPREPPAITSPLAGAGGFLDRIGTPSELPAWLSEEELDYYVETFARTGFRGGLNWYRNFERTWQRTADLPSPVVGMPALFLAGAQDIVIAGRDAGQLEQTLRPVVPDLRGVHVIDGAGHWVHQQHPAEVNARIVAFLESLEPGP